MTALVAFTPLRRSGGGKLGVFLNVTAAAANPQASSCEVWPVISASVAGSASVRRRNHRLATSLPLKQDSRVSGRYSHARYALAGLMVVAETPRALDLFVIIEAAEEAQFDASRRIQPRDSPKRGRAGQRRKRLRGRTFGRGARPSRSPEQGKNSTPGSCRILLTAADHVDYRARLRESPDTARREDRP